MYFKKPITQVLRHFSGKSPESCALFCNTYSFTSYEELENQSNQVANTLIQLGVSSQDRIFVCSSRNSRYISIIFGILKAGAIYVPVSEKSPFERMCEVYEGCLPRCIVCDKSSLSSVDQVMQRFGVKDYPVLVTDDLIGESLFNNKKIIGWSEIKGKSKFLPNRKLGKSDLAYILYTSGSTGKPKGVCISHGALIDYSVWASEYLSISETDRVLGTAPFYFDMSIFDIFATIYAGATLYIADNSAAIYPATLVNFINEHQLTIWKGVSSLLSHVVKMGAINSTKLKSLKKILFAGETLPTDYLIAWMESLPGKQFYNAYGPTEATGVSAIYKIPMIPSDPGEVVPIGQACKNTIILLICNGRPVKQGETGEIYISGTCLSSGYWNNSKLTEKVFIPNPLEPKSNKFVYKSGDLAYHNSDGNLVYVSRIDDQIKYQGYRIELPEISVCLLAMPGIKDSAVIFSEHIKSKERQIIAFVEPDKLLSEKDVINYAKKKLPIYMVPKKIIILQNLPRTDRGKVDKMNLSDLAKKRLD